MTQSTYGQIKAEISGYMVGPIWRPAGEECYKHVTHSCHDQDKLWSEPGTLRDHMEALSMREGGDFQHCQLAVGELTLTIRKPNRTRSRTFPLSMFPSIADYLREDWDGPCWDDYE